MNCPNCQNQVEIPELWEFFDCPHCLASLELAGGALKLLKPVEAEPSGGRRRSEKETSSNETIKDLNAGPNEPAEEEAEPPDSPQDFHTPPEKPPPPAGLSSSEEKIDEAPLEEEAPPEESFLEDREEEEPSLNEQQSSAEESRGENIEEFSPETNEPPPAKSPEDLSSIADFGNAPRQNQNLFFYELKISGIDSEELLLQVQQVLSSPRLKISKSTVTGREEGRRNLILTELNAVQAMYLVKQFMRLPVEVSWSQKSKLS